MKLAIQVGTAIVAVTLGIILGRGLGTLAGLAVFGVVLAVGYLVTAPTRRDAPVQRPLKPRGQRAATALGTGVLVGLLGLGTESLGASTTTAMIVIGIGGLIVIGGGVYWVWSMMLRRGG